MEAGNRILIVDDEENMRHMLRAMLTRNGYKVESAENGRVALEMVEGSFFDFILCDIRMPEMDGLEFLGQANSTIQNSTVIMMSAYGSVDLAIEAMKRGAYDFISKPFKTDEVLLTLKKAEEREALKSENRALRSELKAARGGIEFHDIIGESKALVSLIALAKKVAPYDATILITGESGVGKELIARSVHAASSCGQKTFVAVNCGSIPSELLESELFGYVKGAFTGADKTKKGLFEEADGSTLFLDEIGELSLAMQVKLLRVLQENEIRPIGSNFQKKINVRILAATARNLEESVNEGTFRKDLYYRLNVMPLQLPPLRDRLDDIPLLSSHFLTKYNKRFSINVTQVSSEAMAGLLNYDWPGNVRELENVIQRGVVLTDSSRVDVEQLPAKIAGYETLPGEFTMGNGFSLKQAQKHLEKAMIEKALQETSGNKSKASQLLEISYPSLLHKIKEYSIS